WLVAAGTREPGFLRYALVDETVLLFLSPARFHLAGPVYFYATVLPWALGAWTVVLAASAGPLVRLWRQGGPEAPAIGFAARAAAVIVLLFSISASKRAQYVLPAVVPLALLAAIGVAAAPARIAAVISAAGRLALLAGLVAVAAAIAAPHIEGQEFFVLTPRVLAACGLLLLGWGMLAALTSPRRPLAAVACAACFAPGLGLTLLGPLTPYAEARSARTWMPPARPEEDESLRASTLRRRPSTRPPLRTRGPGDGVARGAPRRVRPHRRPRDLRSPRQGDAAPRRLGHALPRRRAVL